MDLYFSQYFAIEPEIVEEYGAFDISVASDLPLFIDPFLLFNSSKPEYQALHENILTYLRFLRDKSVAGNLPTGLVGNWYRFKEVKQNWLGFTVLGNAGHALGPKFAAALNDNLAVIFQDFGNERITKASHLEKLAIVSGHVGRDGISDFTTNLIKEYLLGYTQAFALKHLLPDQRTEFAVPKVRFNYQTESWEADRFTLPNLRGDYVLLTPRDMLTAQDTWISAGDLQRRFHQLVPALPNQELRAQVDNYFRRQLSRDPSTDEINRAVWKTVRQFPEVIDHYIRKKEDTADEAVAVSEKRVQDAREVFVEQLKKLYEDLEQRTDFYRRAWSSFDEALARVHAFKQYVEHQDGYKLINRKGQAFAQETEVHLFFGLIWFGSAFDVNREVNNGRGPVDFKISIGSADKSLIEFKLASNTRLRQNLEKQVEIYARANQTDKTIKVIICYTERDQARVAQILKDLGWQNEPSVVLIDARSDNKPSASRA